MIDQKQKIYGFVSKDHVADHDKGKVLLAKEIAQELSKYQDRFEPILKLAELVEQEVQRTNYVPTVDYYTALSLHFLGVPIDLMSIFICFSKAVGWLAHIQEQQSSSTTISIN